MGAKTQWSIDQNEQTPFNALDEYERLMGDQRRQTQTWRSVALVSQIINIIGIILIIWAFNLPKSEPIFISVNDIGETRYIGGAKASSSQVSPIMIESVVRKFITNLYTIPSDSNVLKNNLLENYAYLNNNAAAKLSSLLKADNPFDIFGTQTQSVQIESVLLLSESSYQIDFVLTSSRLDATNKRTFYKRAILSTALLAPSEDDILINPAGIYIIDFDVTNIEKGAV